MISVNLNSIDLIKNSKTLVFKNNSLSQIDETKDRVVISVLGEKIKIKKHYESEIIFIKKISSIFENKLSDLTRKIENIKNADHRFFHGAMAPLDITDSVQTEQTLESQRSLLIDAYENFINTIEYIDLHPIKDYFKKELYILEEKK